MQQLATLSEADASIVIEELTRKRRKFEMSGISYLLHEWVERCRQLRLGVSIRNHTLKETALKLAAMLKLPAFRPSYRWLNRFRSKYKYENDELGYTGPCPVASVLPLEQIIVEFKHALPNFMQKELADIDMDGKLSASTPELVNLSSENSEISDGEDLDDDGVEMLTCEPSVLHSPASTSDGEDEPLPPPLPQQQQAEEDASISLLMNAGSCTLLSSVFPHLAIIHQFALMNSDVQALELISQLGVHMQQQATAGAYQTLTLPSSSEAPALPTPELPPGSIYADIDDIELIE